MKKLSYNPKNLSIQRDLMVYNVKFLKHVSFSFELSHQLKPVLKRLNQQKSLRQLNVSIFSRSNTNLNLIQSLLNSNHNSLRSCTLLPCQLLTTKQCIKIFKNFKQLTQIKLPASKHILPFLKYWRTLKVLESSCTTFPEILQQVTGKYLENFLHHKSSPLELLKLPFSNKTSQQFPSLTPYDRISNKINHIHYILEQYTLKPFDHESLFPQGVLEKVIQLDLAIRESTLLEHIIENGPNFVNLKALFLTIKDTSTQQFEAIMNLVRNLQNLSKLKTFNLWILPHISSKVFFAFFINTKLPQSLKQLSIHAQLDEKEMNNVIVKRRGKFFFPNSLTDLALHVSAPHYTAQVLLAFSLIQMTELSELNSFNFHVVNSPKETNIKILESSIDYLAKEFRLNLNDVFEKLAQLRNLQTFSIVAPYLIYNEVESKTNPSFNRIKAITLCGSHSLIPNTLTSYLKTLPLQKISSLQLDTKEILGQKELIERLTLIRKIQNLQFLSMDLDIKEEVGLDIKQVYRAILKLIGSLLSLEKLFFNINSLKSSESFEQSITSNLKYHKTLLSYNFTCQNFNLYKNHSLNL